MAANVKGRLKNTFQTAFDVLRFFQRYSLSVLPIKRAA